MPLDLRDIRVATMGTGAEFEAAWPLSRLGDDRHPTAVRTDSRSEHKRRNVGAHDAGLACEQRAAVPDAVAVQLVLARATGARVGRVKAVDGSAAPPFRYLPRLP